jgi:pimeloyl-ACP methyl ester carboxylesterase
MAYGALTVIRPVVAAVSRLAPGLTGRVAFQMFCRPPQPTRLSDEQRKLGAAADKRLAAAERLELTVPDNGVFPGAQVAAYRFVSEHQPPRGVVALVHGWTGRAAFMTAFAKPLTAAGYDVVALDLPGHGASSGRTLHVPLGVAALHALHAQTGPWTGVIAHSFGGPLVTAFMDGTVRGREPVTIGRLVMIASPHSMTRIFHNFGRMVGLGPRAQQVLDAQVQRLSGRDLADFEGPDMLARRPAPTLILHAIDDKEVPAASAEAFGRAGRHVEVRLLGELGHRRILYAPAVVRAAVDFVAAA